MNLYRAAEPLALLARAQNRWSLLLAADICRPLRLVVTNYISFVSVLYTKTHSFRCSSSSRKVFWTFREPCYAPFIVHRTRSQRHLGNPKVSVHTLQRKQKRHLKGVFFFWLRRQDLNLLSRKLRLLDLLWYPKLFARVHFAQF